VSAAARLIALPRARRRLIVRAFLTVAAFRVALSVLPFRWTRRLATREPARSPGPPNSMDDLAWAVAAAARRVPRATCLTQALALQALLTREGHNATLRLGVARGALGALEAHAWLESDGRVIIGGPQAARFVPLPLPAGK
jgi:transglutaminase superfamily protein